jgi:hypothetical protein
VDAGRQVPSADQVLSSRFNVAARIAASGANRTKAECKKSTPSGTGAGAPPSRQQPVTAKVVGILLPMGC